MPDFINDKDLPLAEKPGDIPKGLDFNEWGDHFDKVYKEHTKHSGVYNRNYYIINPKIIKEEVKFLAEGEIPTEWKPAKKWKIVVAGVKIDYTKFVRKYTSLTFQRFIKVTFTCIFHPFSMPATSRYDFTYKLIWYVPIYPKIVLKNILEERDLKTSSGFSVDIGVEVKDVSVSGEFGYEEESMDAPSNHPLPEVDKLLPDEVVNPVVGAGQRNLNFNSIITSHDKLPLTQEEVDRIPNITSNDFIGITDLEIVAASQKENYNGFVRYLINRTQRDSDNIANQGSELNILIMNEAHKETVV